MKKGIVMDIDESFLTLMTPEGEFLRAKKQNIPYTIGEEIHFFPFETEKNPHPFSLKKYFRLKPIWVISTLAAFIIFFSTLVPIYQGNKAYAYMSIDANPSIEIGINKDMKAVALTGINKEGKSVISSIHNWKKKTVSQLTQTIFHEMKKEGYLKQSKPVIISTVLTQKPEKKTEEQLKENLNEIKKNVKDQNLKVTIYSSTQKEREAARKLGITAGKYHDTHLKSSLNKSEAKPQQVIKDKKVDNQNITQPPAVKIPPGQAKKQMAPPNQNSSSAIPKGQNNNDANSRISPGQLKKIEEVQTKLNHAKNSVDEKKTGQLKKQGNQIENYIKNHENHSNDYNENHSHSENHHVNSKYYWNVNKH